MDFLDIFFTHLIIDMGSLQRAIRWLDNVYENIDKSSINSGDPSTLIDLLDALNQVSEHRRDLFVLIANKVQSIKYPYLEVNTTPPSRLLRLGIFYQVIKVYRKRSGLPRFDDENGHLIPLYDAVQGFRNKYQVLPNEFGQLVFSLN